jgi:hypothetical protein
VDIDEHVVEVYLRDHESGTFRRLDAYGPRESITSRTVPAITVDLSLVFPEAPVGTPAAPPPRSSG